jgi:hypothetical protein
MTDRQPFRIPPHVFVLLSASTAAYAITLAGVAGLQSANEAALGAERGPVAHAIEEVGAGHDALLERLERSRAAYAAAARSYLVAGTTLPTFEAGLADLATVVASIDGVSRSLPTAVRLPSIRGSVPGGRAPATHATTGASGG